MKTNTVGVWRVSEYASFGGRPTASYACRITNGCTDDPIAEIDAVSFADTRAEALRAAMRQARGLMRLNRPMHIRVTEPFHEVTPSAPGAVREFRMTLRG